VVAVIDRRLRISSGCKMLMLFNISLYYFSY